MDSDAWVIPASQRRKADTADAINELMQRGLGSPQAIPGRIGKLETAVTVLNTWWLDRVLGPATQPRAKKESDARAA